MPSVCVGSIRVFVLDNTRIATQLLHDVLSRDERFQVLLSGDLSGTFVSAAVDADVALVSASMEGDPLRGCDFVRRLHAESPRAKVVILVDQPERKVVLEAFRSGARGVFCRTDSLQALAKCILSVHKGQVWAGTEELHLLLEAVSRRRPSCWWTPRAMLCYRIGNRTWCVWSPRD